MQNIDEMEESAKARGTGIAKRSPEYVAEKSMKEKQSLQLLPKVSGLVFVTIETWSHGNMLPTAV
jgi:hypothetical protein